MLQKETIEKIVKEFYSNQNINAHVENNVLLANSFGNDEDREEAKKIHSLYSKKGHMSQDLIEREKNLRKRLYPIFLAYKEQMNNKKGNQYLIVETWNGEGYSEENKAYIKTFKDNEEVARFIFDLRKQFGPNAKESQREFKYKGGNRFRLQYTNESEDVEDSGSITFVLIKKPIYGVQITCNVNEFEIFYNEEEYMESLDSAISESDEEEVEEIEDKLQERIFLSAYEEDYDYQFVRLV